MPPFTPYWQGVSLDSAASTERIRATPRRSLLTAPAGTRFVIRDPARDFAWQPSGPLPDDGPADLSRIEMIIPENPAPRPDREQARSRRPGLRTLEFRPGRDDVGTELITRPFRPDRDAAGSKDELRLNAGDRPAQPDEPAPGPQPAGEQAAAPAQAADRPATSAGDRSPGPGVSPASPPDRVASRQPDPASAAPALRDLSADPDIPSSAAAFLEALRTGDLDEETLALPDNDLMPVILPGGHTVPAGVVRQLVRAATVKTEAERQALIQEMDERADPFGSGNTEQGLRFGQPAVLSGIMPGVLQGRPFTGIPDGTADQLLAGLAVSPDEMRQRMRKLAAAGGVDGLAYDQMIDGFAAMTEEERSELPEWQRRLAEAVALFGAVAGVRSVVRNKTRSGHSIDRGRMPPDPVRRADDGTLLDDTERSRGLQELDREVQSGSVKIDKTEMTAREASNASLTAMQNRNKMMDISTAHPPYDPEFPVYKGTINKGGARYMRVVTADRKDEPGGGFLMRVEEFEEIMGLPDPGKIMKDRFALSGVPTHFSEVNLPEGVVVHIGVASHHPKLGRGGGVQIEIVHGYNIEYFSPARSLDIYEKGERK